LAAGDSPIEGFITAEGSGPAWRFRTVDEHIVQAQHLHERMLDELSRRPGREQWRALGNPGVSDRVTRATAST
jgi:hypothetical protein